jgi:pyrophosphatase PpaX
MARLVLFDLDGTLIDTTDLILASCAFTFERHCGWCPPREAIVATFGRSLPETLLEFAEHAGFPDPRSEAIAMLATYRAHNDEHHDTLIRAFEGIPTMLEALRADGYGLGVVTSKREGAARRGLCFFGLDRYFEVAVFHDDTAHHKPHPEPLLHAIGRAGSQPSETVYVGDSVHDVAAGRAAGVATIAALWGPFSRADLEAAGPEMLAASPVDVVRLLVGS